MANPLGFVNNGNMEKRKTLASMCYRYLSCNKYLTFSTHKERQESLILVIRNDGGSIRFEVIDLLNNETQSLDNPKTGEYVIPLKKGSKAKVLILASKAIGAYKIIRKITLD